MPEGVVYDVSDVLGLICLWNAEGQSGNAGATPMLEVGRDVFTDRTWQTPKGHCLNDVVWNAVMVARGPPPSPTQGWSPVSGLENTPVFPHRLPH